MSRSKHGDHCGRACNVCGDEGSIRKQRDAAAVADDEPLIRGSRSGNKTRGVR